MPARSTFRFVHRTLALVGPLASAACGGSMSGGATAPIPNSSSLVTQETIAASGAKTAWDALKRTVPYVRLRESKGRPARLTRRGPASIYLDDQVDRKSTRLNSSHSQISYAVFCLKKKKYT